MFKTILTARAELIKPSEEQFKAAASRLKENYGFDLRPQIDLLYVRSCLVTTGQNDNDDVFIPEDTWMARHTPVMKPANWQHQEKDIVGVVYSTEARTLDGTILDFTSDIVPDSQFEFWTEAAVYKLIHPDRAKEIEDRAAKGTLFVSMEAWFDDYNYALLDSNKSIAKIIARNSNTAFLDKYLRINGGAGKYENFRVGRGLKNITFGGYGFVDVPANKRSVIDSVLDLSNQTVIPKIEGNIDSEDDEITSIFQEKEDMEKVTASDTSVDPNKIADTVITKLAADRQAEREARAARKAAKKAEKREERLVAKASESSAKVGELQDRVTASENKSVALVGVLGKVSAGLDSLIKVLAGATSDTPPEISSIDAAIAQDSGDAVFQAKIAWITKSMASLAEKAAQADELGEQMAKAALALREQEIRALFDGVMSTGEVEVLVKAGLAKTDAAYEEWLEEKRFFVAHLKSDAAKKGKKSKKDEEKMANEKEPDDDEDDYAAASLTKKFAALINGVSEGEESDLKSGVNSGSLKNPRFKIAGEAVADGVLENAEAEKALDLKDAKGGEEVEEENGFRTLAATLCNNGKKDRPAKAKAGFDPVEE